MSSNSEEDVGVTFDREDQAGWPDWAHAGPDGTFGMTEDEILRDFPDLAREDIRACLAFAADRERKFVSVPPA